MGLGYELRPVQMGADPVYFAHPSANITPDVVIGEGAKIHGNAIVEGGAQLGVNSIVGPGAHINGATLGEGAAAWDYSHVRPGAELGTGVGLGHATIVNTNVKIGDYSRIQNQVSIPEGITVGGSVFIGPGAKFPNDRHPRAFGPWEIGETEIGFGASIGANATVVCGEQGQPMRVGEFATLAAGSVATKSLLPFGLYKGNERMGWVDPVGNTISRDSTKVPSYTRITDGLKQALEADKRLQAHPERVAQIMREVDAAYDRLQS